MGGAASGKYEVKSCGNAHAWCAECRPDIAAAQRKPKPPRKPGMPHCRNCGTCDHCLGLIAPEGMKICRKCGETKPFAAFLKREATSTYRNQCMKCMNGGLEPSRCQECGRKFHSYGGARKLCAKCRPRVTKPCSWCGMQFVGSTESRAYCSAEHRDAALKDKRITKQKGLRDELLAAYGGKCNCARCPETNPAFLTLEHVNGTGKAHRAKVGSHAYADLRRRGFPRDGYTLLCWNCNAMTRFGRTCPHEED